MTCHDILGSTPTFTNTKQQLFMKANPTLVQFLEVVEAALECVVCAAFVWALWKFCKKACVPWGTVHGGLFKWQQWC